MKRLRNIFCIALLLFASLCVFGCGKTPPPNDDNSDTFLNLKNIVEEIYDVSSWQGMDIQTFNGNSEVIGSFKSNKGLARSSNNVDFIHIKGNHKIYCDDGVRYYIEDARKYLDESEFDYSEYESNLLSECLTEVEEFFKDTKNAENLLNSSKLDKADNIEYTFEILLDASTNKKLVATYICDKNNKLIMIKVSISDNSGKIDTEIKENTEIVITPEWFDLDDYKTDLTYEDVKSIFGDEHLLGGWDSAEWFLPVGYSSDTEDKTFVATRSEDARFTYTITDSTKEFFDGENLFVNENNQNREVLLPDEEKEKYTFEYKAEEFKTFAYNYFFYNETVYKDYYVASKKYEKDITVISYKYFGEVNDVVFESICSLIYDTEDNLVEIRCYAKQESSVHASFELNLYMKKLDSVEIPEWFDFEDYNREMTYDEVQEILLDENLFATWLNSSFYIKDEFGSESDFEVVKNYCDNYFFKTYTRDGTPNYNVIRTTPLAKSVITNGFEYIYFKDEVYNKKAIQDPENYFKTLLENKYVAIHNIYLLGDDSEVYTFYKTYSSDGIIITLEAQLDNDHVLTTFKFNRNHKLYYIDVNAKIEYYGSEERHLIFERLSNRPTLPEWFDVNDFDGVLLYEDVQSLFEKCSVAEWLNYKHSYIVEYKGHEVLSDGVHAEENAHIFKFIENDITYSNYVIDRCVSEEYKQYNYFSKPFVENEKIYANNKIVYKYIEGVAGEVTYLSQDNTGYLFNVYNRVYELLRGEAVCKITFNNVSPMEYEEIPFQCCIRTLLENGSIYTFKYFRDGVQEYLNYSIYLDDDGDCYKIEIEGNLMLSFENADMCKMTFEKTSEAISIPEWFDKKDFVANLTFAQTREFLMNVNLFEGYNGVEFVETSNDTTRTIEFYGDGESIYYYSRYDDGFDYGWGVSNDRVFYKDGIEYTYNEDSPVSSSSINTTYINFVENLQDSLGVDDMFVGVEDEENPLNNTNFKAIQYLEDEVIHTNIEFCIESSQKIQKVIIHVYDVFIDMDFYEKTSSSDFDLYYSISFKLLNVDNLPPDPEWFDYGDFPDELTRDEAEEYLESVDFGVNHWDGFFYDYVSQGDGSPARVYLDRDDTNGDRYIYESEWVTIKKSYGVNGKDYYYREGEPYSLTDRLKYSFRYDLLEYNENYTSNCGAYELYNTFIKELANNLDGISLWDEITTSNMVYTLTQYDEEKVFTMSYIIHLPDDLKNYYDDNSTINLEVVLIVDDNNKFQKFSYKEFTESKVFTYMRLENYKEEISDPEWFNKSDFADVVIDLTLDEARTFASQDFYSSWTGVIVYNPEEFDGAYQLVYEKKSLTNGRSKYIYQYQNEGDYDDKEYCDGEFVYKYVNGIASSKRVYNWLVDGLSKFDDELLFGLGVNGDGLVSDLTEENVIFLKKITHFNGEYEVQMKLRVLEDNYITFVFKFTSNGVCYEEDVIGEGKYNGEDVVATRIMRNLSCGYNLNPSTNGFVVLNTSVVEPEWFNEEDFVDVVLHLDGGNLPTTNTIYTTKNASISIEDPEKYGYTFLGWSYEQDGSSFVDLSKGFSDNVVNLYAVYSVNSYMIKYNILVEDESGSYYINNVAGCESVEIDFDTTFNLPNGKFDGELIPELKKDGYVFVGWSTSVGDAYYLLGSSYLLDKANDINFYACWVATEDDFCLAMDEKVFKYSYHELGKFCEIPNAILLDLNSEGIVACEISWEIICDDGLRYQISQNGFKPLVIGEYSIKYIAISSSSNEILTTRIFTITVRDTIAPNIAIDGVIPSIVVFNPDSTGKMIIELPYVDAVDGNLNEVIEVEISIKDSNEQALNVSYNEEGAYFTVDKPGTYVIRFYAIDDSENSKTHVYTIQVVENV